MPRITGNLARSGHKVAVLHLGSHSEAERALASSESFIVDNSDEHWKALEYLRQWCEISESIDIATGHFELGALLALDGAWQKVQHVRLLIGGETSRQTADVIAAALDASIAIERAEGDPFLTGAGAVVEAIRSGKVEIRTYKRRKFHAKTYITHGRLDVVGSAALVGSSNFTRPGLTRNVELNVRFSGAEVVELQKWFDTHWGDAEPVRDELLTVLEHNTRTFTPYEVYAKSLQALTADLVPNAGEWERNHSAIYPILAPYQREAYHGLMQMERRWGGGFLTDGVGLGKTFVGLMLTEYFAVNKRMNVLIMATKTGQDAVWLPELKKRLPGLFGELSNVLVMAHTDLSTRGAPDLVRRLKERVDVVIIDEGHNFRNHGKAGDDDETVRSRWWRMQDVCQGKKVFLLTATPINNSLFDLVHQAEMFSGMDDGFFAPVGVSSVQRYVADLEKPFRDAAKNKSVSSASIDLTDFDRMIREDRWLESIIWQNSRKYAVQSSKLAGGAEVIFPEQKPPQVVAYKLLRQHSRLLDELEAAFKKSLPLFVLPMYYPLAYSRSSAVDTIAENRQKQIVGLIRTTFLKRFESSVAAFAGSCLDLAAKISTWLDVNTQSDTVQATRLVEWHARNDDLLIKVHERYRPTQAMPSMSAPGAEEAEEDEEAEEAEEDVIAPEFDEHPLWLDPAGYDIEKMIDASFDDLHQLASFLDHIADVAILGDNKYDQLRNLLTEGKGSPDVFTPEFRQQKVIIFTEFADTARYLHEQLAHDGVADLDRLDGTRKTNRVRMIRRFSPFYNDVKPEQRKTLTPLRVLISTDVLSEGVNLQDATLVVNYDLHWNPVRLMQRIGRVDRRMNVETENAIVKADPSTKASRGVVQVRNFLPPDDLERLLLLYKRIEAKILLISKTLGIPGGKLIKAEDMHDDVKVMQAFQEEYEGSLSPVEELRLRYLQMLVDDPDLERHIESLPAGIAAAKTGDPTGVFVCQRLPARVTETADDGTAIERWTLDGGTVAWSLRRSDGSDVDGLLKVDAAVFAEKATSNTSFGDAATTRTLLRKFESDLSKAYRKEVQLPLDAPAPQTICWMEIR